METRRTRNNMVVVLQIVCNVGNFSLRDARTVLQDTRDFIKRPFLRVPVALANCFAMSATFP